MSYDSDSSKFLGEGLLKARGSTEDIYVAGTNGLYIGLCVLSAIITFPYVIIAITEPAPLKVFLITLAMFLFSVASIVVLIRSSISMNTDGVICRSVFGQYGIRWDEIKTAEIHENKGVEIITLLGSGKRLVIPLSFIAMRRRQEMRIVMQRQLEKQHGVPLKRSNRIYSPISPWPRLRHKNTRLKRGQGLV